MPVQETGLAFVQLAPTRNPFNYDWFEQTNRNIATAWLTLTEIKNILQCSYSTIAYHLYEKTRQSTKRRINPTNKKDYNRSPRGILNQKYCQFFRMGHTHKISDTKQFTFQELEALVSKPFCYLTGQKLDLSDGQSYSLDHKA